jgi:Tfp pilus assembly protein PilF
MNERTRGLTIGGGAHNRRAVDEGERREQAIERWRAGYACHVRGDLAQAIALYTESIEICPTAEAYTFRGWAYSFIGRIDDAIAECRRAIEVDPDFGNPYNDIGSYLIAKGELDEAVAWLERAKQAPRYEPRHFPYMNLGRLYAAKGMIQRAIVEFEGALKIEPEESHCRESLIRLRAMLN